MPGRLWNNAEKAGDASRKRSKFSSIRKFTEISIITRAHAPGLSSREVWRENRAKKPDEVRTSGHLEMVDVLLYGDLVDPFFPVAPEEDSDVEEDDQTTVRPLVTATCLPVRQFS